MRDQITQPILTVPGYVTVVAVVVAIAALLGMAIARVERAEARAATRRAEARLYRNAVDHAAELDAGARSRLHLMRSRDEALLELRKWRALARTMADELDRRTKPNGWSMRAHEFLQQPGEPAKCIECGAESPAGGPLPELPCPGPAIMSAGFDGREPLEPARYPHPVTVARDAIVHGVTGG